MTQQKLEILVVEDSSSYQRMCSAVLGSWGYNIITVPTASEAKEYLNTHISDLVLMDTKLDLDQPRVKGYDTCRELRATEYGKKLAVIGMSRGYYLKEWKEAGADDFVEKHNLFSQLRGKIEQVLKKYGKL